jgi:peptidoglycan/xylan/chitin deacetylase (PgdA/CDA1 family)
MFSRLGNEVLLELFRKHGITATFFVTGYFAEREPDHVRRLVEEGHEVAAHGYEHHYRGREFDVAADVLRAKKVLEKITCKKVLGFRSPQAQYSLELLKVLDKAGFAYDSSLHPAYLPGYYDHSKKPLRIFTPAGLKIKEIPVAVIPRWRLPIVWMFMRLFGVSYTQLGVDALERRGINANLYFHSWEFVPMRSKNVPFYFTFRTGRKFVRMLENFILINKKKGRKLVRLEETI